MRSSPVAPPEILRTREAVRAFMATIGHAPFVALDTETTGLDPNTCEILLIQVGTAEDVALIDAQAVGPEVVADILVPERPVVMHHAKFDLKMLASFGGEPRVLAGAAVVDTMLCERLLRNGRRTQLSDGRLGLATLAERYAGMTLDKSVREGFIAATGIDALSEAELRYAERDVVATWKVFAAQLPMLAETGLVRAAAIEGRAAFAFAQMEGVGFPIDQDGWRRIVTSAEAAKAAARQQLDAAFEPVLERDLFGVQHMNYERDEDVLQKLRALGLDLEHTRGDALTATGHPAALALVEYREHAKIVSTYGESFLEHVHPTTGRLHADFRAIGASSGRASCSKPNLQNIPKGSSFRACFRAPEGRCLITADYATAELRILAEVSQDPVFLRTFNEGGDLHAIVAAQMFGRPVSKEETPELRDRAKAINFGLVYGMGAVGLAKQISVTVDEASALLERYFDTYPAIRGYLHRSSAASVDRGWAQTLSGRRFWLTDMTRQGADGSAIERVARNMPIQGSNADITKVAMARVAKAIADAGLDAQIVNMVHDEIVVEASYADAEPARDLIVAEMRSAGASFVGSVPMDVDAQIDHHWSK